MKTSEIRSFLIPLISTFTGFPIIEADQNAPKPDGVHATYKFTTPYAKDGGMPNEATYETGGTFYIKQNQTHRTTISFTSYAMDNDDSFDLAQTIRDWFDFAGVEDMQTMEMSVVDMTGVDNRDAFVVDDYERRNGFDVILRSSNELLKELSYFDNVDISKQ